MILQFKEQRRKLAKAEHAHRKAVRRYLRDISVCLPCCAQQKRAILTELRTLIDSHPQRFSARSALEETFGTPEEIAHTYIGDHAVSLLRSSARKHRIILFSVLSLLLIALIAAGFLLASPMVYYTETVTVLENETESVYLPQPYTPPQIALPRTGIKTVTCYDHRGVKLWTAAVRGTFGYVYGTVGQALDVNCTLTVYTNNGLTVRHKDFLFPDAAVSTVTADYNGSSLQKKIILTCDRFGNLS